MKSRHFVPLAIIMVVIGALSAAVILGIDWLPAQAAEQAPRVDDLTWFLVFWSWVIFTIVTSFLVYSIWRFRAKPGDESDGPPNHGNTKLEIVWTVLPVMLLVVIGVWAVIVVDRNEALAADREVIEVKAWQFAWEFTYPEAGVASGDLRLPAGRQVELRMRSTDVIHDLFVPEFRVKEDVVPGITTNLIVDPTKPGTYPLICYELCGAGHSLMRARAIVMPAAEYDAWKRVAAVRARAAAAAAPAPAAGAGG
jgi:cytochrome c oxidase subunit 2